VCATVNSGMAAVARRVDAIWIFMVDLCSVMKVKALCVGSEAKMLLEIYGRAVSCDQSKVFSLIDTTYE
jgi:hypothetical protein